MLNSDNNKTIVIRKSNELIEARYKLSLAEQRLIFMLAAEISPNDKDFKSYQIHVAEFARLFGLESCNAIYKEVQKAAKELVGKRLDLSKNGKEIYTTWLSYVEYVDGSGIVKLEFHSSLKPYLLQLKNHFTQYNLDYVINFSCQYSVRFYELLKMDSFKAKENKFNRYFEIDELRLILGLQEDDYKLFGHFKDRVINPAIKEINEKTDLKVEEVQYGKIGRKITSVTFTVTILSKELALQQQAKLENAQAKAENESHPVIEKMVSLGFSEEIAKKYKNKYGIKRLERNIAYTLAKKQENLVKDIPAYLNKAIESDLGGAWDIKQQKETVEKQQKASVEKARQAEEKRVKQERQTHYTQAFERFMTLSEEQKILIKAEFINYSNATVISKMKELESKGRNFFDSVMVSSNFKVFLVTQKGF